jgi:hypothetical protein
LKTQAPLEFRVDVQKSVVITFPFGAGASTEHEGHAHRFTWIDGSLVVAHDGTPYFKQEPGKLKIQVPAGEHAFCIARATTMLEAYQRSWEFFYPPVPFLLPTEMPMEGTCLPVKFEGCIPTSFRARAGMVQARFLSIDGSVPVIEGGVPVDFTGKPKKAELAPWRILNYTMPASTK